jgi:hypothetical protein
LTVLESYHIGVVLPAGRLAAGRLGDSDVLKGPVTLGEEGSVRERADWVI